MTQQIDNWYQWHHTATEAVCYAQRMCLRWGETYWWVWKVKDKGYLTGRVSNYYGAKLVCRVSILGQIKNLIGEL
jgi:hypothetical protein